MFEENCNHFPNKPYLFSPPIERKFGEKPKSINRVQRRKGCLHIVIVIYLKRFCCPCVSAALQLRQHLSIRQIHVVQFKHVNYKPIYFYLFRSSGHFYAILYLLNYVRHLNVEFVFFLKCVFFTSTCLPLGNILLPLAIVGLFLQWWLVVHELLHECVLNLKLILHPAVHRKLFHEFLVVTIRTLAEHFWTEFSVLPSY